MNPREDRVEIGETHTRISCHACRSRKVKCSRELPGCFNCRNCGQTCVYPSMIRKPGPKLGSVHKRRRLEHQTPRVRSESCPTTPHSEPSPNQFPLGDTSSPPGQVIEADSLVYSEHVQAVSELCHPSNETLLPPDDGARHDLASRDESILMEACGDLDVSVDWMGQMIETFFRTFTSFHLFRKSDFHTKLTQIPCAVQLKALLAAIFAFAIKGTVGRSFPDHITPSSTRFADAAIKYVDEAVNRCGDEAPPLCVLQALILATHWMIIRGVRGRAWRYVGTCIRVAFELGLHNIDAENDFDVYVADPEAWCRDEERRRAYWAVWEMDQFASHIKHIPITISWARDGVHLPAEDENWLAGRPQRSCALSPDLISRCKNLQATGNRSANAWYIMIASLNAEAYEIAYPRDKIFRLVKEQVRMHASRWPTLFNTIQLSLIVLPQTLKFHGQYLDFGSYTLGVPQNDEVLHVHSKIYEIALMPETSKVIALRPYVFEAYMRKLLTMARGIDSGESQEFLGFSQELNHKVEQCYRAADSILNLILNCHESHYRYINPYVTHVSWLAATVQLLHLELVEDESQKQEIRSKFEILKATNDRFVQYWEMSRVPKQNLETLESKLRQFTVASKTFMATDKTTAARAPRGPPNAGASFIIQHQSASSAEKPSQIPSIPVPDANADVARIGDQEDSCSHSIHRRTASRTRPAFSAPPADRPSLPAMLKPQDFAVAGHWHEHPIPADYLFPTRNLNSYVSGDNAGQEAQIASTESDPLDWLSFFSDAEWGEELTDYFDMFSGPIPT